MAQIKIAEYTFDSTNTSANMPFLTPNTITMTTEDVVISDTVTKRIVYIDNAVMPTQIKMNGLGILEVYYLNIDSNITSMNRLFHYSGKLTYVNTENWDTRNVTDFGCAFEACGLTGHFDLSHLNTGSAIEMYYMFCNTPIKSVNLNSWDMSKVTNCRNMFSQCSSLERVDMTSSTNLSACSNFYEMFSGCKKLKTVKGTDTWKIQNATDFSKMFYLCNSLQDMKGLEDWNVSKVTGFGSMFRDCSSLTKLDLRNWVTSSATTMQDMFSGCSSLEVLRVDNFNTSKVTGTGFGSMFYQCKKLKTLNLNSFTNSGNLGNFNSFCSGCSSLEYISMQNFVWGNCTSINGAFSNCTNLKMLDLTNVDSSTVSNKVYGFGGIMGNVTCPVYYNSNTCSSTDFTDIPNKTNLIDVQGRLMAVYDFKNTETSADVYPILTGSTITKTIDTQGSESYITHRVIGVDVMPTAISFNPIPGLLNVDYLAVTSSTISLANLFYNCFRMESVNTFGWDSSNVTNIQNMFRDCSALKTIHLYSNMGNLTNASTAFYCCGATEITGYENWVLVGDATDVFAGTKLTKVDISTWDMTNVVKINSLFQDCSLLQEVIFGKHTLNKVTSMHNLFYNCTSLMELDLSGLVINTSPTNTMMFYNWTSDQIVYVHDTNWTIDTSSYNATFVRRLSKLITKYTFDNTTHPNCLPRFNKRAGNGTVDYIVSDIVKDNITTRLLSTDGDLPQHIQFADDDYAGGRGIISCDYLDTSNCISLYLLFYGCTTLTSVNTSSWDTSKVTNFYCTFLNTRCTEIDCSNIDTSSATSINRMFDSCSTLTSLDLSSWDVSKVTDFSRLFQSCYNLKSLNISGWNTSSATNMDSMFSGCGLTELDVSHLNTSNVTNMSGMFSCGMTSIDLSGWDVRKVQQTRLMFNSGSIKEIKLDGWNTESLTDMWAMFCGSGITTVDINHFNVSKVTSVSQLFDQCRSLVSVDMSNLHFTSCQNISSMFSRCSNLTTVKMADFTGSPITTIRNLCYQSGALTEIDLTTVDVSRVTDMSNVFEWATSLKTLDLSTWDTRKVTITNAMFQGWDNTQTVYYEPPFWSIGTTTLNSNINWVIKITRNNGYWLDMSAITGDTIITLFNENNLPTEEILTDWGDGTQNSELTHTYSTAGEYVVVSNLQLGQNNNKVNSYLTKATIYYLTEPYAMFYSCSKLTDITFTDNWVESFNNFNVNSGYGCDSMFYSCKALTTLDTTQLRKIKNVNSMKYMFSGCSSLTELDLSGFDTSKVTSMTQTFANCNALTSLNLNGWDMSKVTEISSMFNNCWVLQTIVPPQSNTHSLKSIADAFRNTRLLSYDFLNEWDFSQVTSFSAFLHSCSNMESFTFTNKNLPLTTNIAYMFSGCTKLKTIDFSGTTIDKNVSMLETFRNCSSLESINFTNCNWKPTTLANTFNACSSLTSIDLSSFDLSNVTSMQSTFQECRKLQSLDMSSWKIPIVTTMAGMCNNCVALQSVIMPKCEVTVGSMNHMFVSCSKMTNIDFSGFVPIGLTSIAYLFSACSSLTELDLSTFNMDKVTYIEGLFNACSRLKTVDCSSMRWKHTGTLSAFYQSPVNTLGLLYMEAEYVNKWVQSFQLHHAGKPLTVYYYDADPTQLTPVEGVVFKKYAMPTTIQLPPHIKLHSLPDGTRDEVDIKTGILTRNVGEIAITGQNINWVSNGFATYDGYTSLSLIADWGSPNYTTLCQNYGLPSNLNTTNNLSPNAKMSRTFNGGLNYWAVTEWGVGKIGVHIPIEIATLSEAKQWLNENPIIIRYATTKPTTEKLILNYNNSCDYGRILPTGMCDKYDVVNSMYTQTMTSILLDGENTWDAMEEMSNVVKFTATGTTVGVEELNMLGAGGLYCDNDLFPNINDDSDVEHCRVDEAGNKFYIYISKDRLMSPDLIGYQIWLQANPFNLIYELAEHLTYVKPYEELDPTQARWEGMDCMRDGAINYHTNSSDNITMYPTLEYVAPSINNFEVTMLEPNTEYTIYAEGINTNDTINLGGTDINFNNGTVYTSGDNQWLRIDNNDSFYNMVITKGDTTGEVVPYFEGMTSVENPKLLSNGEGGNLFNGELYVGMLDYLYGTTNTASTWYHTDYLELEQNTDYRFIMGTNSPRYALYDENKVYISGAGSGSINTGSAKYTRISAQHSDTETEVQLTLFKGTTFPTEHIPYSESTVSYTNLKLRSLPNGVKDTINVVTGEYVQRVGEMLLNGDESWEHSQPDINADVICDRFRISVPDLKSGINSSIIGTVSSHIEDGDYYNLDKISISSHTLSAIYLYVPKKLYGGVTGEVPNVNRLKTYLSKNPISIQYELTTPITTKLDPQTLLAYADGTINLSSDTGLLPTTHYTVPSTNTFHLPSMKTGTRYTLKYPSASGSITIGDINYSISSDSMLFTTPLKINGDTSAIIFSDTNPENVVLLEGAYNKREVPFFTGVKSVKNPNITIIDQLSTESTTYNCETEIELRGLPNGVADKLDIIKGKLTTNVGIRPYQEGDENLPNIWTDGYETVYALSSPVVTNVTIDQPTITTNSLIELSSDYLIPQLNYRAPSSNNFPLDLLQPNTTYTLYADTLVSGSYTLGGTRTGVYSQPHTITLGDMTDNLLTFNGDLGLSNVMLVKGNSLKTTLPPYFLGIRSVTDGHLLVEGMAGEMNELTFDEGIVLRDCNGVKDTIDLITCTLTKRTGEITLNGSEGWTITSNPTYDHEDYAQFQVVLSGIQTSAINGLVCDRFAHKHLVGSMYNTEAVYSIANAIRLCIKKTRIGGDTVNALKAWLNQNPTTVVYTLTTPLEVPLENVWTTLPPTSYNNQTEISSTVSTNSLKPMISVTIATTTLEEIVSNLEARNTQLEEENMATMLALTSVYETMAAPMAAATMSLDDEPSTINLSDGKDGNNVNGMSVSPIGMVYVNLIRKGLKTIEQVPYNLQAEVMYALRGME